MPDYSTDTFYDIHIYAHIHEMYEYIHIYEIYMMEIDICDIFKYM